ncbi:MAG: UPF0175 family protein [Methanosarcinales archaeon]|nr:UPF0175 family protein [Methanosarcinales archaeon]
MNEISVSFPKSLEITLNKSESETISTIKEIVALHLYKSDKISLGKAGQITGKSKREMLHLLSFKKIPINFDIDDLESDLVTLNRVLE